jgi:hypothetical protein
MSAGLRTGNRGKCKEFGLLNNRKRWLKDLYKGTQFVPRKNTRKNNLIALGYKSVSTTAVVSIMDCVRRVAVSV